jgi:hypothetical protein
VYLNDDFISQNSGQTGTALSFSASTSTVINNTVHAYINSIYAENSNLEIAQNIFWNNMASDVYIALFNTPAQIHYNDIKGNWPGNFNINADPAFNSLSGEDFGLRPTSPCIDNGNPAYPHDTDGTIADIGSMLYYHKANFIVMNPFALLNQPVEFFSKSYGHNMPYSTYEWDFNNDGIYDSQEINPVFIYNQEGDYTVKLRVTTDAIVDSIVVNNAVFVRDRSLNSPANISITAQGNNIHLQWEPVTTYTDGSPAQVAGYVIYESIEPAQGFTYLSNTTGSSYSHLNVAEARSKNFYTVVAIGGSLRDLNNFIRRNPVIMVPHDSSSSPNKINDKIHKSAKP